MTPKPTDLPKRTDAPFPTADIIRVLDQFPLSESDRARLDAVSPRLRIEHVDPMPNEPVIDPDVEVVFGKLPPAPSAAPKLRWLQVSSAGVDYLANSEPWQRGITVTNARGVYAVPMAEYVMTAVLSASQRVEERRQLQEKRRWPESFIDYENYGVRGKTMVIIGYGAVGRETARVASAFGMRIMAVKADPTASTSATFHEPGTGDPEGVLPECIVGVDALDSLLPNADYVVVAAPLTPGSRHLLDARRLRLLAGGAWVINVARGAVIDEAALIDVLSEQRIGGAWLDVFSHEPLPETSPLWSLPNTVVTPHVSGGNRESLSVLTDLCCENLRRYVAGDDLLNVVDPRKGY